MLLETAVILWNYFNFTFFKSLNQLILRVYLPAFKSITFVAIKDFCPSNIHPLNAATAHAEKISINLFLYLFEYQKYFFFFLAARCRLPSPQSRPSKSRDSKSNTEDEETRKATPTFSKWMVGQKLNKSICKSDMYFDYYIKPLSLRFGLVKKNQFQSFSLL